MRLFADDKSLYIIVESPQTAVVLINTDFDAISIWTADWLVDFHVKKNLLNAHFQKTAPSHCIRRYF